MTLFDTVERTDTTAARRAESAFNVLNRSADPQVSRVRESMETWFGSFPEPAKAELASRLRSGDQRGFESAFFELFLHEVAHRLGCELEPHPELTGTSKHPDFLVRSPSHEPSYLEAVVSSELSDEELGAEKRADELLDGLNRLEVSNFFLGVCVLIQGPKPLSQRRLRQFAEIQLAQLTPQAVENAMQSGALQGPPRFRYRDEGWDIELTPMPKSAAAHAAGAPLIGIEITPVRDIDTITPLNAALKKKSRRYGRLDKPYLIALSAMDMFADEPSVRAALFGTEDVRFKQLPNGTWTIDNRYRDALWISDTGPQYTRVSGVIFARKANPGNLLSSADMVLYLNPWADHAYTGELTQLRTLQQQGTEHHVRPGRSVRDLLQLTP